MILCETSNLRLRHFEPSDAPALFYIYSDPETMRFMGPPPASVDEERKNINRHIDHYYSRLGYGLFAIELTENGALIGRCGILRHEIDGEPTQELSYLIRREQWGQGFATEAANAVVSFAASQLGFHRLIALIAPENKASVRVAEKCGFQFERAMKTFKGWNDVSLYTRDIHSSD